MATLPSAASLAARSVHIKVYPTTNSLPERRQVLRVLEKFGHVDMFRSLRYDKPSPVPNAFLSILRTPAAAAAAIAASPLRYTLVVDSETTSSSLPQSPTSSQTPQKTTLQPEECTYELRISPTTYPHHALLSTSPLHGPYKPVARSRSPIAADLWAKLPTNMARQGLTDWVTGSGLTGIGNREIRSDGQGWADAAITSDAREERKIGQYDANATGNRMDSTELRHRWVDGEISTGVGDSKARFYASKAADTMPWRLRDKGRGRKEDMVEIVMRGLRGEVPAVERDTWTMKEEKEVSKVKAVADQPSNTKPFGMMKGLRGAVYGGLAKKTGAD